MVDSREKDPVVTGDVLTTGTVTPHKLFHSQFLFALLLFSPLLFLFMSVCVCVSPWMCVAVCFKKRKKNGRGILCGCICEEEKKLDCSFLVTEIGRAHV